MSLGEDADKIYEQACERNPSQSLEFKSLKREVANLRKVCVELTQFLCLVLPSEEAETLILKIREIK